MVKETKAKVKECLVLCELSFFEKINGIIKISALSYIYESPTSLNMFYMLVILTPDCSLERKKRLWGK